MKAGSGIEAKVAAVAVVVSGALSFVVATVDGSSWRFSGLELLVAVTVWLTIAFVGWRAPRLAAYAMVVVALWGFLLAYAVGISQGLNDHADNALGVAFAWWFLLPVLATVLFVIADLQGGPNGSTSSAAEEQQPGIGPIEVGPSAMHVDPWLDEPSMSKEPSR